MNFPKIFIAIKECQWYNSYNTVKLVSEGAYPEMELS